MYALKLAKDFGDFKAISQNMMHKSISITDGIYDILSESDVKDQINSLGVRDNLTEKDDSQKLMQLNKELIKKIENNYLPINLDDIED